jgi:hypothetical protein
MATLEVFEGSQAVLSDGSRIQFPASTVATARPDVFSFPGPEGWIIRCDGREARVRHKADAEAVRAVAAELEQVN